jgi:hypothetical protein
MTIGIYFRDGIPAGPLVRIKLAVAEGDSLEKGFGVRPVVRSRQDLGIDGAGWVPLNGMMRSWRACTSGGYKWGSS